MNSSKKAVLIGAGQFGRGVIAMCLSKSGYDVLLADIDESVIEDINSRHEYKVTRIFGKESSVTVRNVSAINSKDDRLIEKCADCDIICTCTGLTVFPVISDIIAKSISERYRRKSEKIINVLACENALGGSTILKNYVAEKLNDGEKEYMNTHIGFPDCAIDGIIPPDTSSAPADVTAEEYFEWDALKSGFKGTLPEIEDLHIVDDLSRYLERKIFTLNGPNAVTGCYGFRKGYKTVQEALADSEIYSLVWSMMEQAGMMLSKRHGFTAEEMLRYRTFIMERFLNPAVIDSCERVAREPVRKLSSNDRIVAAMNYAHELGTDASAYYKGIACVMAYDNPNDPQSMQVQKLIKEEGFLNALEKLTGIKAGSNTADKIQTEYLSL